MATCEACEMRPGEWIDLPGLPGMCVCVGCHVDMAKAERLAARFNETPEEYEERKAILRAWLAGGPPPPDYPDT